MTIVSPDQLAKIIPQARAMLWCLKTGEPIDHDVSARADLEELGLIAVHFPRENWKITLTADGQRLAADIESVILNAVKLDDLEALRALHYKTVKTIDDGAAYALNQAGLLNSIDGFHSYALTDLGKAIITLSEKPDPVEDAEVQIDLQPATLAPDPLANMDADGLRAIVAQLKQQMSATTADIADLRDKLASADKIAKKALGDNMRAERERDNLREQIIGKSSQLLDARARADQLEKENSLHEAAERNRKTDLAAYKQRAAAAEQRVAELTAPRPDGHIIARAITEAELDALADQGRKVTHFQFMPDGTLNAVIEPLRHQPQPRPQRNQPAYTISGLPIPQPVRVPTPHIPHVPTHNQHHAPRPVGFTTPPTVGTPNGASAIPPTAAAPVTAVMVITQPVTPPARVPTFSEILTARTSGQITAEQFTKYSNALAGHNAAQRVMETHS